MAAIPSGLLESELFGHERGAFTGAFTRTIGRFERASRGTLFLDEIGDLPLDLQPKLLRVMQERQFERLGSTATIHTDVRVICSTHRNLVEMVEERQFRADLFYRLSVFPMELPPLRERPEDIRLLVHHFAMDCAHRMQKPITDISEEFITALSCWLLDAIAHLGSKSDLPFIAKYLYDDTDPGGVPRCAARAVSTLTGRGLWRTEGGRAVRSATARFEGTEVVESAGAR